MNIVDILRQQSRERPDQAAIIDYRHGKPRTTTFGELERFVDQSAAIFADAGFRSGDKALVFQPMSLELYVALLSLFQLEIIAMFLDPSAGRKHIEQCCAIGRPDALVSSKKAQLLRIVSPALRHIPHRFILGQSPLPTPISGSSARSEDRIPPTASVDVAALLTFTSGSTGEPKAAMRTHAFLLAQHKALAESLNLRAGDVDLSTLPIFVLANLASGVTTIIPDADLRRVGNINAGAVVAQILEHKPNRTAASPAFLERIVEFCEAHKLVEEVRAAGTGIHSPVLEHRETDQIVLPSLTRVFTGGAPVFPKLLDRLAAIAPNAEIVAVYGSTEAEPITEVARTAVSDEDRDRMRTGGGLLAGIPVSSIALRVIEDRWGEPIGPFDTASFDAVRLPTGVAGEIVVAGGHVLKGYVDGRGDAETKFRIGDEVWHRTGDAGYLDDTGRVWLLGRCSAKIDDGRAETGHGQERTDQSADAGLGTHAHPELWAWHPEGSKLYPFAVETAVHNAPGLIRSAAIALDGRRILVVEMDTHVRLDGEEMRRSLAWAGIDEVVRVARIPVDKRHNAKIDYPALRRMFPEKGRGR